MVATPMADGQSWRIKAMGGAARAQLTILGPVLPTDWVVGWRRPARPWVGGLGRLLEQLAPDQEAADLAGAGANLV